MPKLRSLPPLVRTVNLQTTRLPTRQIDPTYNTVEYRVWRAQVIARAGGRCEAVDHGHRCTKAQPQDRVYADHVAEIRDGGAPFDIRNGECLCAAHHTRKTVAARTRRLKG
jgi:5-methylcytosine-specific restriction enzyme A